MNLEIEKLSNLNPEEKNSLAFEILDSASVGIEEFNRILTLTPNSNTLIVSSKEKFMKAAETINNANDKVADIRDLMLSITRDYFELDEKLSYSETLNQLTLNKLSLECAAVIYAVLFTFRSELPKDITEPGNTYLVAATQVASHALTFLHYGSNAEDRKTIAGYILKLTAVQSVYLGVKTNLHLFVYSKGKFDPKLLEKVALLIRFDSQDDINKAMGVSAFSGHTLLFDNKSGYALDDPQS